MKNKINISPGICKLGFIFLIFVVLFWRFGFSISASSMSESNGSPCTSHQYEYSIDGNQVYAHCTVCNKTESVWFEINGEMNPVNLKFCLCEGTPEIMIKKTNGWDSSLPLARLVFTSPFGKVTYHTAPENPEDFGTVHLEVYTGKILVTTKAVTEPMAISAQWPEWAYSTEGVTLFAKCASCGQSASVIMDADGANAANLNALRNKFTDFDYEVFIDNGWTGQKGIADYYILYDGTSVSEDYMTGIKCDAFRRPTNAGNYSARAALLTNPLDPKSVYLSTDSISYYISTIPVAQCERKDYSEAEWNRIFAECKPTQSDDGWYQVGTRDELLWIVRSGEISAKINITADIVVNPITVDVDTGEILCGAYDIFNWIPLGWWYTYKGKWEQHVVGFAGTIRGNGHTISGLYNVNNDKNMGFISLGTGCTITDLTLENCVFSADEYCGAFIGKYSTNRDDHSLMTLSGLSAYCCAVTGSKYAGGIIGNLYASYEEDRTIPFALAYMTEDAWLERDLYLFFYNARFFVNKKRLKERIITESDLLKNNYFTICDSVSSSNVKGGVAGGGIIGAITYGTVVTIENCTNCGRVEGGEKAAGIIGSVQNTWQRLVVKNCKNGGTITAPEMIGGILGYVDARGHLKNKDGDNYTSHLKNMIGRTSTFERDRLMYYNDTLVEGCISIGPLGAATYIGGIVGYYDMTSKDLLWGSATMIDCKFSQTRKAIGASNRSGFSFETHGLSSVMAEKISDSTPSSYLCENLGRHIPETRWEYNSGIGCEQERTAELKCRLCGEILETKTAPAHNHQFVSGECNFCGEKETNAASIFSDNRKLLLPMAGVIVIISTAFVFYKKKVKKNV